MQHPPAILTMLQSVKESNELTQKEEFEDLIDHFDWQVGGVSV